MGLPELEVDCERCGGEGEHPEAHLAFLHRVRCDACNGLGTVLTEAGRKVFECVIRRLAITSRERE